MRTKALLKLIAPYTRFTLAFIAKQLKISVAEVEDIVSFLIVDKKLKGMIDQANGTVDIEVHSDFDRTQAMRDWTSALRSLWTTVLNNGEGFRSDDASQIFAGRASASFTSQYNDLEGMRPNGGRAANGWGKARGGPKRGGGGRPASGRG